MVSFAQSDLEPAIRSAVSDIVSQYDEDYWLQASKEEGFPEEFWSDMAENEWIGVTVPEEHGGQGLGMQELIMILEEVVLGGGWPAALLFLSTSLFGGEFISLHGTDEQRREWLPRVLNGEVHFALGVTEPNVGLDTTQIETTARREGDEFVISGQKTWTTMAGSADRIILLTRTTPLEEVDRPSQGLSLFIVDPADPNVDYDEIPISIWHHDPSYNTYYDDVRVHESQLLGEEDKGLYNIFDILNGERIAGAASANSLARFALNKAVDYAKEREVFGSEIGSYQGIQHQLADAYADLRCTRLMIQKAAWTYDNTDDRDQIGQLSNMANLKACERGFEACDVAMTTFGGMSASEELGIAQIWQDVRHNRTAPVSEQMLRNHIAENALGLPRSY